MAAKTGWWAGGSTAGGAYLSRCAGRRPAGLRARRPDGTARPDRDCVAQPDRVSAQQFARVGSAGVMTRSSRRVGRRARPARRARRRFGWRTNVPAALLVAAVVGGVGVGYLDQFDAAGSTARTPERTEVAADGSATTESLQSMTPRLSSAVNPEPAPPVQVPEQGSGNLVIVTALAAAPPGPDRVDGRRRCCATSWKSSRTSLPDRPAFAAAWSMRRSTTHAAGRRRDAGSSRSPRNPSTSG